jgi:hypothetical protein
MKYMKNMEFLPTPDSKKETTSGSLVKDIIGAAALVGAVGGAPLSAQDIQDTVETPSAVEAEAPRVLSTRERVLESERLRLGEHFSLEQYTYTTLYEKLTNRQVMFTDEQGIIIGEPVNLVL